MVWHDCKTDPPKETNIYLLAYKIKNSDTITWDSAFYSKLHNRWEDTREWGSIYDGLYIPLKWAEVDLSEVTNESVQM